MALIAPSVFSSTPKCQMKLLDNQLCPRHQSLLLFTRHRIFPICSMKTIKAQFDEPGRINLRFRAVKERLWQAIPEPVKQFPWEKAKSVLLNRLVFIGQKALKWSLITLFILSGLSDGIYAISRNKELMIPIGLLVGYLMANFLKEISVEMFQTSPEGKGLDLPLLGISCFFVFVKIISPFFVVQTKVFLLHVANGGLMQVLWLARYFLEESYKGHEEIDSTS